MTNLARFNSSEGLFTSIVITDPANAAVIRLILELWLNEIPMQCARRGTSRWEKVYDIPTDFNTFLYRKEQ